MNTGLSAHWFAARPVGTCAGAGTSSRPTGKMKRRRKLLEIAAESPALGARFVGQNAHRSI